MEPVDKVTVEQRLAAIEEKLDLVLARLDGLATGGLGGGGLRDDAPRDDIPQDHISLDNTALEADPILELVRQGRKIQAIKAYRERTGAGLRQAKDAIDAMALRERPQIGRR
jgi:ribosomal protein L7/L12